MMPTKKLVLSCLLLLMAQINCSNHSVDGSSSARYGMQQLSVGQQIVYFKREIRGRNYEGLSISTDSNLCNGPSPKTDYFVNSETSGRVFYKVENNELQIYSQSVFTAPQNNNFPISIVQRKVLVQDFSEDNALKLGYTELLLPVDSSLKDCDK